MKERTKQSRAEKGEQPKPGINTYNLEQHQPSPLTGSFRRDTNKVTRYALQQDFYLITA